MPLHRNSVRIYFLYNSITDIFDEKTVIVTWDTLHIILTLSIFITLVVFTWIMRLDPCQINSWRCEDINTDKEILRCLNTDKAMFAWILLIQDTSNYKVSRYWQARLAKILMRQVWLMQQADRDIKAVPLSGSDT